METKRYCGNCLAEVPAESLVCSRCGADLPVTRPGSPVGAGARARAGAGSGRLDSVPDDTLSRYDTRSRSGAGVPGDAISAATPAGAGVDGSVSSAPESSAEPGEIDELDEIDDDTVGEFKTVGGAEVEEISESWTVGRRIAGRFTLSHCIGQGGMGKVFLARDEILGRLIALKRVPQEIIFDSDARDDLRQEANRLLDLAHENIIRVHTYYDEPDWPFFAMEYLEGPTLKKLLNARKKDGRFFSFDEERLIARQVGKGLAYAHKKNLIHRDLKPANLMFVSPPGEKIAETDIIKITDFGISRVIADSTLRQTGKRSGTLPYMSPEQFRGEECTVESDVYSLAATYYELLSGRPPFYTGDIGYQILNLTPKPIPNLPRGVNGVLLRALSKNPHHRFTSVEEFTAALERRRLPDVVAVSLLMRRVAVRGLVAVAGLVLVALAALGVRSLVTGGGAPPPSPRETTPSPVASAPGRPAPLALDPRELARTLQAQLEEEIPIETAHTSLTFQIRKEGGLLDAPRVLEGLFFELDPDSESKALVRGTPTPAGTAVEYHLDNLGEGLHFVRAQLDPEARRLAGIGDEIDIERYFTVDLTGPEFTIEPFPREAFVGLDDDGSEPESSDGESEYRYATFRNESRFRLVTSRAADIAKAFYQAVKVGRDGQLQPGSVFPIDNPLQWTVTLHEGQNTFLVYAEDQLGNESEKKKVRITRLQLKVSDFSVAPDSPRGNEVVVEGTLNVEGGRFPHLHFFVNDSRDLVVRNELGELGPGLPHFRAVLTLPRYTNTVEVRYEWGGEIFPFEPPQVISDIRVAAPKITLSPEPVERTNTDSLKLSGTVDPYFDGLTVRLDQRGVGSRIVALRPITVGGSRIAEFEHDVLLSKNKSNELEFVCDYDGTVLRSNLSPLKIYCDMNRPRLLESEFTQSGQYLHLRLVPSEKLSRLRVRRDTDASWHLELATPSGDYMYITEIPTRKCSFTIEMTDLVGNVSTETRECNLFFAVEPTSFREDGEPGDGTATPAASVLEDLGLEFKSYGSKGEWMCRTEVTERAWHLYLGQRGFDEISPGARQRPAVVGPEFGEELLLGFCDWLTLRAADGYEYFIPTPDQWRAAFMGSKDPRDAKRDILAWFQGKYPAWSFRPFPDRLYGRNEVLPVGSRPENETISGLLDMESNLQEIVRSADGTWYVLGGWNTLRENQLRQACLEERKLAPSLKDYRQRFTGFRVARRKKTPSAGSGASDDGEAPGSSASIRPAIDSDSREK